MVKFSALNVFAIAGFVLFPLLQFAYAQERYKNRQIIPYQHGVVVPLKKIEDRLGKQFRGMAQVPETEIDDPNPGGFRKKRDGVNKKMVKNKADVFEMFKDEILETKCVAEKPFIKMVNGETKRGADFRIDYEGNTFLLDGKPFRYISGSIHYFRVPREYWRDRLRKIRALGLNAISTYVEWSAHERVPGKFDFSGDLNITEFLQIAKEEDLHVILRPGPYICAERDMGGLPYWLLQFHPDMYLRSKDSNYLNYVERWMRALFNELEPLWVGNGGPIIMAQIENEFGSYPSCDKVYTSWLRDLFQQYIGDKAVLFTTDGAADNYLRCGKIPGVYATVDFGPGKNVTEMFQAQRRYEPQGPLVNSEFYPGWLTHWGEKMANVETTSITKTLKEMLDLGANVNFYMIHGGTNFGFTAGANFGSYYQADIQSYDYDAPITEAGDLTEKYYEIQKVIAEYEPIPNVTVATSAKENYGELTLKATASLFAPKIRSSLGRATQKTYPTTFEAVGQNFGYLLYETTLPESSQQELQITNISDLAHVYVNEILIGNLSRECGTNSIKLGVTDRGDKLSIVVENLGRINFGGMNNDTKGILSNVTLGEEILTPWDQTSFELDNVNAVEECYLEKQKENNEATKADDCNNGNGFMFYVTKFQINPVLGKEKKSVVLDSYLNVRNLNKGVVFVNGFNIGRYWSTRGPQYTLYIPGVYLKSFPEENVMVVMDEEIKEDEVKLSFTTEAIFDRNNEYVIQFSCQRNAGSSIINFCYVKPRGLLSPKLKLHAFCKLLLDYLHGSKPAKSYQNLIFLIHFFLTLINFY